MVMAENFSAPMVTEPTTSVRLVVVPGLTYLGKRLSEKPRMCVNSWAKVLK